MGAGKQKIDGLFLRSLLRARLLVEKKKNWSEKRKKRLSKGYKKNGKGWYLFMLIIQSFLETNITFDLQAST